MPKRSCYATASRLSVQTMATGAESTLRCSLHQPWRPVASSRPHDRARSRARAGIAAATPHAPIVSSARTSRPRAYPGRQSRQARGEPDRIAACRAIVPHRVGRRDRGPGATLARVGIVLEGVMALPCVWDELPRDPRRRLSAPAVATDADSHESLRRADGVGGKKSPRCACMRVLCETECAEHFTIYGCRRQHTRTSTGASGGLRRPYSSSRFATSSTTSN